MRIRRDFLLDKDRELSGLLVLLALLVVLPTVGLFLLLAKTVENERFAVRQRLESVHGEQLTAARETLERYLSQPAAQEFASDPASRSRFVEWLDLSGADTLVLLDESGSIRFPVIPSPPEQTIDWTAAEALEFRQHDWPGAIRAYRELAAQTENRSIQAQARQRVLRCLIKAQSPSEDIQHAYRQLEALGLSHNAQGDPILPNAQLLLLQHPSLISPEWETELVSSLHTQLRESLDMPLRQRAFLQQRLAELGRDTEIPRLAEERLAVEKLAAGWRPLGITATLVPVPDGKGWTLALPDQGACLYYPKAALPRHLESVLQRQSTSDDITIRLVDPGSGFAEQPFIEHWASPPLTGWRVGLFLEGDDPFQAAARQAAITSIWIAVLAVACIFVVAFFLLRRVLGQLRLTRLKNDFLATVSHELKTPLASSRLLIDTLLDGHIGDRALTERYLRSISRENERLTSLIENFLTFSRIQRGETPFHFQPLEAALPAERAREAVADRYAKKGLTLDADLTNDEKMLAGDENALTTALINLLDNALKYSPEGAGPVRFRLDRRDEWVRYEVSDCGIGISKSDQRKITEPFFQANRSLSRPTEGCGLGLGIVRLIAEAHGGRLEIDSEPGRGSTFRILIPADPSS